jgi:hypothetical protein
MFAAVRSGDTCGVRLGDVKGVEGDVMIDADRVARMKCVLGGSGRSHFLRVSAAKTDLDKVDGRFATRIASALQTGAGSNVSTSPPALRKGPEAHFSAQILSGPNVGTRCEVLENSSQESSKPPQQWVQSTMEGLRTGSAPSVTANWTGPVRG